MPYTMEPDDDIRRLPYIYYGPVIKIAWLPVPFKFRGRPLSEWAVLGLLLPITLKVVAALVPLVLPGGIVAWAATALASWAAAAYTARWFYNQAINNDRPLRYLLAYAWREYRRWWRARGPLDRRVAAIGIPLGFVAGRMLASRTGLSALLWWPFLYLPTRRFVRWVVARTETRARATGRALDRMSRQAINARRATFNIRAGE